MMRDAGRRFWRRWWRLGLLFVIGWSLLLGAGTGHGWPAGEPFASPQAFDAAQSTTYVPIWYVPGTKFGVAGRDCAGQEAIGASWFYTWAPYAPPCEGREHSWDGVPMIWGDIYGPDLPQIDSNSAFLLGPNECDRFDQCALTVAKLAPFLRRIYTQYPDRLHISPAPSSWALPYLVEVRAEYIRLYGEPPPWHALAMHCYDSADGCIRQIELFKAQAQEWDIAWLWLTEFAYTPEMDVNWREHITALLAYLDGEPMIARYAAYVSHQDCGDGTWKCVEGGNPQLFEIGGGLTLIGREYVRPTPEINQ